MSIISSRLYYFPICHNICSHTLSICCSNCNQLLIIHRIMPSRRRRIRQYWNFSKQYHRQTISKTRRIGRISPRSTNWTCTRHLRKRTRELLCLRWISLPTTSQICSLRRSPYSSIPTAYTITSISHNNGTICCSNRSTPRPCLRLFFTGEYTKLETFKRQFNLYKRLNANYKIMQSPCLCTMLILTFIKGPFVEDWAADQVKTLEEKVICQVNPMPITDNALWTEFMTAFNANFFNVTQK